MKRKKKHEPVNNFFVVSHEFCLSEKYPILKTGSKALYPFLCHLRNRYGKTNGLFKISDKDLMTDTGFTKQLLRSSRKDLYKCGFIFFIPGTGRKKTIYYIRELNGFTEEQFQIAAS